MSHSEHNIQQRWNIFVKSRDSVLNSIQIPIKHRKCVYSYYFNLWKRINKQISLNEFESYLYKLPAFSVPNIKK